MKYLLFLLFIAGCKNNSGSRQQIQEAKTATRIIYIQPLGVVSSQYINTVKASVEQFYGFKCEIRKAIPLTKDILANSVPSEDLERIRRQILGFVD